MDRVTNNTPWTRHLWFAAGWLWFAVGAVGVVLPGIPTTGPMILALTCFSKSSPRFHAWLYHHRVFGPPLQRWEAHRVIPPRAKFLAVGMMSLSLLYLVLASSIPAVGLAAIALCMGGGAAFILRCPGHPPVTEESWVQQAA